MPLTADVELKAPEKKDWPVIPEEVYQVEITDLTADESEYNGEKKPVFKFEFTIIEEGEHYGRKLWKRGARVSPVPYKNGKNPLTWKVASAVAKRSITEEEGKAYTIADMNALIGKQLRVGVSVTAPKEDGKQYNNVEQFFQAKQNLPPFDESKVKKDDQPAKPMTPAATVEAANAIPQFPAGRKPTAEDEDVEYGEVDPEDIPL